MRTIYLLLFLTMCAICALGQDIKVKSIISAPDDLSASVYSRIDNNNEYCALVKIRSKCSDIEVSGNVVGEIIHKSLEHWAYISPGTKKIELKSSNFYPILISFADYLDVKQLNSKSTYIIIIDDFPAENPNLKDDNQLNIKVDAVKERPHHLPIWINGVVVNMIKLDGGTFQMGNNNETNDESPVHDVTLNSFMLSETEVTQELWEAVMGNNPSHYKGRNLPVENVSYDDCLGFIKKINKITHQKFRFPTEAEWEFAAKNSESHFLFAGSNDVRECGWCAEESAENKNVGTHEVKTKKCNKYGLYDMNGNVEEWCEDWYSSYTHSSTFNPHGPSKGKFRVTRGGSWFESSHECRNTSRRAKLENRKDSMTGLRLAL